VQKKPHGPAVCTTRAGEPIATRWSAAHKAEIKRSRVAATRRVADAVNATPAEQRPRVIVSCSAVGAPRSAPVRCALYHVRSPVIPLCW